jgi:hypothetical protein
MSRGCSAARSLTSAIWTPFHGVFGSPTALKFVPIAPWRLVVAGHIALTSEDHRQQYGLPSPVDAEAQCRSMIVRLKIQSAEVREDTRDIVIVFESGERLEILPISSGYESWQMTAPDGTQTIAQGGGNLVAWK